MTSRPTQKRLGKKEKLLEELVQARADVMQAAAALATERQDEVAIGEWSVKDLIAHLIGWDYTNLKAAQELLARKVPSFFARHDRDWKTYNAELVEKFKRANFAELVSAANRSHRKLICFLAAIPSQKFEKDRGVRFRGHTVTLAGLLRAEARDEREHARQVRALRAPAPESKTAARTRLLREKA